MNEWNNENLKNISEIELDLGLDPENTYHYGKYISKVNPKFVSNRTKKGKLVLVTALTPTKTGEGKTFTTISLVDSLNYIGVKSIGCLREPSLGPVFGLKGGAVGGGEEILEPAEDINLHFTGDMHALTSSINLISACIDNHIYQGNELNINKDKITWKRALDMNDRELREIEIGLGSKVNGIQRTDHFQITVASELMAILAIAENEDDFRERISKIIVAYNIDDEPIYLKDLKIVNAVMKLMKQALKPNLVQTKNNNPVFVHAGPFANIAHGCSSVIATKLALNLSGEDGVVVTEAGFGADLGAEKFLDIVCPSAGLTPDLSVLVCTVKALKLHGGVKFEELNNENIDAIKDGFANVLRHYKNLRKYGIKCIVAINKFKDDTKEEIECLNTLLRDAKIDFAYFDTFTHGPYGGVDLAELVKSELDNQYVTNYSPLYKIEDNIFAKMNRVVSKVYNGLDDSDVPADYHTFITFADGVEEKLQKISEDPEYSKYFICFAKTQSSFTDDSSKLGAPDNFKITIKDVSISNGAKFIVLYTGNILTMPGLPKVPRAVLMEEDSE